MKVSTTSIGFTKAERAEIERRQAEMQKLIAQMAATETLEEQNQLAEELCPQFDGWIRGRNRIMSAPTRAPRVVAMIAPRTRNREHRSAGTRRTSSSSTTAAQDPGDGEPAGEQLALTGLKHISEPLAGELERIAARLRTKGGVG